MNQKYESIINEYVNNFDAKIPKDELERKELINELKNYLSYLIEIFVEDEPEKDESSIKAWLDFKTKYWNNMNITELKQMLLKDNSLENIKEKSMYFFRLAQQRIDGEDIEIDLDKEKEIKEFESELKMVKSYNVEIAKQFISEGTLDLDYVINPNNMVTSLRLGHIIIGNDKTDKEER